MSWIDALEAGVDWTGDVLAYQIDGNDLVHIADIDKDTGIAVVRVFAGTDPEAPVIYEGAVCIREHLAGREDE